MQLVNKKINFVSFFSGETKIDGYSTGYRHIMGFDFGLCSLHLGGQLLNGFQISR
jgi:hypothetical protein